MGQQFEVRFEVNNGQMHLFYNSKRFTPEEGIKTFDTSSFFKFGSWSQTRPYDLNPRGSVDEVN